LEPKVAILAAGSWHDFVTIIKRNVPAEKILNDFRWKTRFFGALEVMFSMLSPRTEIRLL